MMFNTNISFEKKFVRLFPEYTGMVMYTKYQILDLEKYFTKEYRISNLYACNRLVI